MADESALIKAILEGHAPVVGAEISKEVVHAVAEALVANKSTLTHLLLEEAKPLDDESIFELARALGVNNTVVVLSLPNGSRPGEAAVSALAEMLEKNTTLTDVSFQHWNLSQAAVKALTSGLKKASKLERLVLRGCRIESEGARCLGFVLKRRATLRALDLQWNEIAGEGLSKLARELGRSTSLQTLDLRGNRFGDDGAELLAEGLLRNTTLQEIHLEENDLGPRGVAHIVSALLENKTLLRLSLDENPFGDSGALALGTLLEKNGTLLELSAQEAGIGPKGATKLAQALGENKALLSLSLDANSVGDEGATKFGFYLERNTVLKRLNLRKNLIRGAGASKIAQALLKNTTLEVLNLQSNSVDGDAAVVFAQVIEKNSVLTHLMLGWNDIGDRGAYVISPVLHRNTTLVHLSLQTNSIGPDGALRLSTALEKNMVITQLLLQGNPIDQESEQRLAAFLNRNKALLLLFEAFSRGDVSEATRLFQSAPQDIHLQTCNKESLLEAACKSGNTKAVSFLLEEFVVKKRTFPLLHGSKGPLGNKEADQLVEAFKLISRSFPLWRISNSDGETLLHWVSANSEAFLPEKAAALIKALVGSGCNLNAHAPATGQTPLLCCQTPAVAVEMLKLGADAGACDLRGCGVESHLSTECLEAVKKHSNPAMQDVILGIFGGIGSRALPGTLHSTADQIIQAALSPEAQQDTEIKQGPWWLSTDAAPRSLPLGCFPLMELKTASGVVKRIRICDLDRLSETVVGRPDMLIICAYATDGPEANTSETWARQRATLKKWLAKAPKSTALLAGMDSRSDQSTVHLLRQHKMTHVSAADAQYHARRAAFHGYGEFELASMRSNLIKFIELSVEFHEMRLAGAEMKEDGFHAKGAFLRALPPLPEATDPRNFVKVIALGPAGAGRSSMLEQLSHKKSLLPRKISGSPAVSGLEATIGIDEVALEISKDFSTTVYDFSGSLEYLCVNEMFLSRHDTLYILVLDASDESAPESFVQWLHFLNDHPRGPADSCRLIVVCNKVDKLGSHPFKDKKLAALLKQKEDHLLSLLRDLPMLAKLPSEIVSLSSKTGENVDKLRDCCRSHVQAIASTHIPRIFRHASDAVFALSRATPAEAFFSAIDFKKSLPPDLLAELHAADPRVWNDVLEHLHNAGQIVADLVNFNFVCLQPSLLAKAFGLFFAPSSHLEQLAGTRNGARADTIGAQEACERIACLPGIDSPHEKKLVMHLLEQTRFCYSPQGDASKLVFPCLRPSCDSLATVLRALHAHRTRLVRLTCLAWTCNACKAKGRGSLPAECPSCGARDSLHQRCAKSCQHCDAARDKHAALPEFMRLTDTTKDPAVCMGVLPTTKKVARIEMARGCMCGEKVRRELKTLAVRINVQSEHVTTPFRLFSGLVSAMSDMLAPEFQLYRNATAFYDVLGNTAAVFMAPGTPEKQHQPLAMANGEIHLLLVVRGVAPHQWQETLPELAAVGEPELLCPICAMLADQHFVPLEQSTDEHCRTVLRCPNGHVLPESGMLTDPVAPPSSPSTS